MDIHTLMQKEAIRYVREKDRFKEIPEEEIELYRKETEIAYTNMVQLIWAEVSFVDYDPYKDLKKMREDILGNQILKVSTLHNDSILLPGSLNLQFRAVHDFLHHVAIAPFNFQGEVDIYNIQKNYYSSSIGKKILYSEVVMQAAHKEFFGIFAPRQKIII